MLGRARPALISENEGHAFWRNRDRCRAYAEDFGDLGLPGEEESAAARDSTEKDLTSSKNFNPPAHPTK